MLKQWIEALRSGKYTQTKQCLKNDKGFCCLGVACEISGLGQFEAKKEVLEYLPDGNNVMGIVHKYLGESTELPEEVFTLMGLPYSEFEQDLIKMNDDGISFSEIADYLEEKLWKPGSKPSEVENTNKPTKD